MDNSHPHVRTAVTVLGTTAPAPLIADRVRRSARSVGSSESREFGVPAALALSDAGEPVEVYVDLAALSVRVALRGNRGVGEPWQVAGPVLRERVLATIGPLLATGWRLDGTFNAATRWDVSVASGPDLYRGCWVRMCRSAAEG